MEGRPYAGRVHVWIDQDLCTGDGLCTDHCPEIFVILEDGIAYVRDGMDIGNDPGGAGSMVPVAPDFQQRVIDSAELCPGECIFIEIDQSDVLDLGLLDRAGT
jgi:ferredoxin